MKAVAIIGSGGFGREVLDVLEACNREVRRFDVLGFVVDPEYAVPGTRVNDKPVLGGMDWLEAHSERVEAVCAVGDSAQRRSLVERVLRSGVRFCTVVHPDAALTRWVEVGAGSVITAGCILTNGIRIGRHVHVNLACTVGHDAVIEDFATISPGVHLSGGVACGRGCFLGTGAVVLEGRRIGAWSTVGAGCSVIQDVPKNATVVGVPGKVVKVREPGWQRKEDRPLC